MLFLKGINIYLAQESEELEKERDQMVEEVEARLLLHANKVSQQIQDTMHEL